MDVHLFIDLAIEVPQHDNIFTQCHELSHARAQDLAFERAQLDITRMQMHIDHPQFFAIPYFEQSRPSGAAKRRHASCGAR